MNEDEKRARIEEIRQKVLAFGEAQYIDGLNKGKENIEALEAERTSSNIGYEKGLEDLWEMWQWFLNNDLETIRSIFPEYKSHEAFMVMCKRVGLAESVRRIKEEYMKDDTGLLYSTISDLKADYTNEQILKAIQENGIGVNNK